MPVAHVEIYWQSLLRSKHLAHAADNITKILAFVSFQHNIACNRHTDGVQAGGRQPKVLGWHVCPGEDSARTGARRTNANKKESLPEFMSRGHQWKGGFGFRV